MDAAFKVGDKVNYNGPPAVIHADLGVVPSYLDPKARIQTLAPMQAYEVKLAHGAIVQRVPIKKLKALD